MPETFGHEMRRGGAHVQRAVGGEPNMGEDVLAVDRERALMAFRSYLEPYDAQSPRIALKAAHTLRVADLCDRIARASGFTKAGLDLAWLCGLLHDIGRFEQLRRWGTFKDSASARHAQIGVDVLFEGAEHVCDPAFARAPVTSDTVLAQDDAFRAHAQSAGRLEAFVEGAARSPIACRIVRAAVGHHSDFQVPNDLDPRTRAFCDLVRDADKIDILRVSCTDTVETVVGATEDELLAGSISPAAEDAFFEHRTVRYSAQSSAVDHVVGLACFAYELAYPASLQIMVDQGHIFSLFSKPFGIERPYTNRATRALIGRMDGHLRAWLDDRLE